MLLSLFEATGLKAEIGKEIDQWKQWLITILQKREQGIISKAFANKFQVET